MSGRARLRIAHLGARGCPGSFSEEAARRWAESAEVDVDPVAHASFDDALTALAGGAAELAVLPLASSSVGLVGPAVTALLAAVGGGDALELAGEVAVPVRLALLARPGAALASVVRVVSHPQALRQCERTLARLLPGREEVPWGDTASAARDVAAGVLPGGSAALASAVAGERHGLVVLAADVQDDPAARTFFAVLRRRSGSGVE